jgi:hypothetical protein
MTKISNYYCDNFYDCVIKTFIADGGLFKYSMFLALCHSK